MADVTAAWVATGEMGKALDDLVCDLGDLRYELGSLTGRGGEALSRIDDDVTRLDRTLCESCFGTVDKLVWGIRASADRRRGA